MVVQHNLRAMNSNRMLGLTANVQSKSTEKLSSGYKINRAADDAAGLSISEKMRKQIRGLSQASLNAADGISAVQTAEGALNEVQDMLQRMNELAVKASNGTMSEDDRNYIQNEIDQLVTEIDRVAETTKFNESYLLKGTDEVKTKTLAAHDAGLVGKLGESVDGKTTFTLEKVLEDGDKITIAGEEYTISQIPTADNLISETDAANVILGANDSITIDGVTTKVVDKVEVASAATDLALVAGDTFTDANGVDWEISGTSTDTATLAAGGASGTVGLDNIGDVLKAGAKVTKAGGADVNFEVVDSLESGEVSTKDTAATSALVGSLTDGVVFSVNDGEEKTVTKYETRSFDDVKKDIEALAEDGTQTVTIGGTSYTIGTGNGETTRAEVISLLTEDASVNYGGNDYSVYGVSTAKEGTISAKEAYEKIADELEKASSIGADTAARVENNYDGTFTITQGTVEVKDSLTLNLHVGADADMTNKISISIDSMNAAALGVKDLEVDGTDGSKATYAVDAILDAIQRVSTQRSALGAVQNRLEHTIANLDNVVENTTAAESQIRDTDMATEMVKYSNNNILAQAGQAMLAQANQANQGVLSLLG